MNLGRIGVDWLLVLVFFVDVSLVVDRLLMLLLAWCLDVANFAGCQLFELSVDCWFVVGSLWFPGCPCSPWLAIPTGCYSALASLFPCYLLLPFCRFLGFSCAASASFVDSGFLGVFRSPLRSGSPLKNWEVLKTWYPTLHLEKREQRLKPAVGPGCLIWSHTQIGSCCPSCLDLGQQASG